MNSEPRLFARVCVALLAVAIASGAGRSPASAIPSPAPSPSATASAAPGSPEPGPTATPGNEPENACLVYTIDKKPVLVGGFALGYGGGNDFPVLPLGDVIAATHASQTVSDSEIQLKSQAATVVLTDGGPFLAVKRNGKAVTGKYIKPFHEATTGDLYIDAGLMKLLVNDPNEVESDNLTDIPVLGPAGKPLAIPANCSPPKPTAAGAALLAIAKMPYPPKATSIWCDGVAPRITAFTVSVDWGAMGPSIARNDRAERELCNGYLRAAARDFAPLLAVFKTPDAGHVPDIQRHYVLTQSLAGNPDLARKLLDQIREKQFEAASKAFFAGKTCVAMRAFVAADKDRSMNPDMRDEWTAKNEHAPLVKAADDECAGNPKAALADMNALGSVALFDLIRGNLYAEQRDWRHAAIFWWESAGDYPAFAQMDWYDFELGSTTSLVMLYYYRAHLPANATV